MIIPATQEQIKAVKSLKQVPPKIMLVDDNEALVDELEEVLTSSGYTVESTSNSANAFDIAMNVKPEVILLDLKMSPKSGFQVAGDIRQCLAMKDTPIIAMTGFFTEQEHVLMMKLCGIKLYLLKPFNPLNLIAKIEFALGNRTEEYP